jgi:DNA replication protein DnaT
MAGEWIKIQTVTPDKPEVFVIADRLGIDPDAVVGKLVRLWIWADQQTTDGN